MGSVGLCGAICQVTFSVMKSTGDEYFTEVRNLAFLVQILSTMLIIINIVQKKKKERKDKTLSIVTLIQIKIKMIVLLVLSRF